MGKRALEAELKVGVSIYTSALCHSVLRLEPYTACAFGCTYCYARWYRQAGPPEGKRWLLRAVERLWARLPREELRLPPFRLSTLSDPLQPRELEERLSLAFLKAALRHRVPVILNTKGTLFASPPWRETLLELASEGLVVLQISFCTLDEAAASLLEPRAPKPSERLEKAAELSDEVPLVVRLQPLVPGLFEREREGLVEAISRAGARHVIVEFLRETPEGLKAIYGRLAELGIAEPPCAWEDYGLAGGGLKRPSLAYREATLAWLKRELGKKGISLGTCKEGLFELQDGRDCCGFRFLDRDRVAYRLTLYEIWRAGGDLDRALREAARGNDIIFGPRLAAYPNPIRKILRAHENKLLRVLNQPEVLARVCPALASLRAPS